MGPERHCLVERLRPLTRTLSGESGFQLVEFVLVVSLFLAVFVSGVMYDTWASVKGVNEIAAREAGRYYAVNISKEGADPNTVLAGARDVAAKNVQQFLNAQPPWFDKANCVSIDPVSIGGAQYYNAVVTIHVPVYAPFINRLLGHPMPNASPAVQAAWDQPIGRPFNSTYVIDLSGQSFFRGEI